jgi:hypothetical protein
MRRLLAALFLGSGWHDKGPFAHRIPVNQTGQIRMAGSTACDDLKRKRGKWRSRHDSNMRPTV